jgi:hypothetical protein
MQSALPKLQRRLNEVKAIDPTQATDPRTPEFESINDNLNATLMEIFGVDSIDYDRYKSTRLYAGTFYVDAAERLQEVVEGYQEGKKRVLVKLNAAIKFIHEKLEDAGAVSLSGTPRSLAGIDLHPAIEQAAGQLFRDGHYASAVENACKSLNNLVQMKSGNYSLDNTKLMTTAFSKNSPLLAFNESSNQTDSDEQEGFMHLALR